MAKRRILVVDDDTDILAYLQAKMSSRYDVTSTSEPKNVLAVVRRERPDVIVCDINMPEVDGVEISNALQADEELRHIPLLFLTSIASRDDIKRLSGQLGGRPAVSKSESVAKLIEHIEALLR